MRVEFDPGNDASLDDPDGDYIEGCSSKFAYATTGNQQFLPRNTKKDFNRFSLNEVASKNQHLVWDESENGTNNQEEADCVRSNFSTEA